MKINKVTTIWNQLGDTDYYVSECGRVKLVKGHIEKELAQGKAGAGYLRVLINGKQQYVHRLVICSAFNIPLESLKAMKFQINHKNGIKRDNRLENLEITTGSRNIIHSIREGLRKPLNNVSDRNRPCYFTQEQVDKMRELYDNGYKQVDIARMFDTIQSTVSRIVRNIYRKPVEK